MFCSDHSASDDRRAPIIGLRANLCERVDIVTMKLLLAVIKYRERGVAASLAPRLPEDALGKLRRGFSHRADHVEPQVEKRCNWAFT
jgi:hypothetical protein